MKPDNQPDNVKVIMFKETKVAVLEHRAIQIWSGIQSVSLSNGESRTIYRPSQVSSTFNILYDNPSETSPDDFRLDICASTERDVTDNSFGVVEKTIPGGRCAVLQYIGDDANLGESITYLYSNWLPLSGEEPRDFPLFLQRVKFFPDVPEHEVIIDVFLPLK